MTVDLALRSVAESQLRDRARDAASPRGGTSARIDSFPFLIRLMASGDVSRIRVTAGDVAVEGMTLARVAVDLHGVSFDRDRLLSDRTVVLESLERGTARAEVTQEELSERIGVPITLEAGRARVRFGGRTVTADASVSDNTLRLSVSGFSIPSLRIPTLPLLPCVGDLEILPGRISLSCTVDRVPPELVGRPLEEVGL